MSNSSNSHTIKSSDLINALKNKPVYGDFAKISENQKYYLINYLKRLDYFTNVDHSSLEIELHGYVNLHEIGGFVYVVTNTQTDGGNDSQTDKNKVEFVWIFSTAEGNHVIEGKMLNNITQANTTANSLAAPVPQDHLEAELLAMEQPSTTTVTNKSITPSEIVKNAISEVHNLYSKGKYRHAVRVLANLARDYPIEAATAFDSLLHNADNVAATILPLMGGEPLAIMDKSLDLVDDYSNSQIFRLITFFLGKVKHAKPADQPRRNNGYNYDEQRRSAKTKSLNNIQLLLECVTARFESGELTMDELQDYALTHRQQLLYLNRLNFADLPEIWTIPGIVYDEEENDEEI